MKKNIVKFCSVCIMLIVSMFIVACGGDIVVDYDLASRGATFTQVTVAEMQSKPSGYLGKTIKIRGKHYSSGDTYHYISGYDETNCCNWSMEIRLKDDTMTFPDTNKNIVVIGDYKSKKINSKTTYFLEVIEFV